MGKERLLSDEAALYVHGLGHLDQYGTYIDKLYSHGVIYFVRDYYVAELARLPPDDPNTPVLRAKLDAVLSDIAVWHNALSD